MFIGHYGLALASKRLAPKTSMGTLMFAAQSLDLLWPMLLLVGVERVEIDRGITVMTPLDFTHYPVSHSLLAVLGWAVLIAGIFFVIRRDRRAAVVIGALVASHWFLDLLVHRPDLPLTLTGSDRYGLGLWNHPPFEIALELILFFGGLWIYVRTTSSNNRRSLYPMLSLVVILALIHVGNIFGPPPPSTKAIAWVSLLLWLFVPYATWADNKRTKQPKARARSNA
jgi:membrane-bound metal-dependent hydrolase YbcI (DUF457 family)